MDEDETVLSFQCTSWSHALLRGEATFADSDVFHVDVDEAFWLACGLEVARVEEPSLVAVGDIFLCASASAGSTQNSVRELKEIDIRDGS